MKRKGIIFLYVIALISLGFAREFVFVNLNTIIINVKFNESYTYNHFFSFLSGFNYITLYISKWFLTAFFIGLFMFLQIKFSLFLYKEIYFKKWFLFFYVLLIFLASLAYFVGWLLNVNREGYIISRLLLGLLQSPFPIIFLIPVKYFYKKNIS
jgi:hypothetical protein